MTTLDFANQILIWQCKKKLITTFLLKEFMSFFNKSILGGMSLNNQHLLIVDGHGSHVTLEAIE
jgi:hypothetical protein